MSIRRLATLFLLFFVSGTAALAYEVIWIRLLGLTLSITVYALTTVLCAYMAGLGIGAAIAARIADRVERPLLLFALAEFGIGVSGLVVTATLFVLGPAYVWLHDALGGAGIAFTLLRFLLAFVVLLVPTILMGTTLPLLSRAAIDDEARVGRLAGGLYATNTLGAVAGCLIAGFGLIPAFGIWGSSLAAAAMNLGVAGMAFALGSGVRRTVASAAATARRRMPPAARIACLAFAVSGFTAMGYELLWSRALQHFTHNSVYAYSAMLATFLAGMGIGSAICARLSDRLESPMRSLGFVQVGIGVSVFLALLLYMQFEELIPVVADAMGSVVSWSRALALIFIHAGSTMFITTLGFGAAFPLVTRIVVTSVSEVGGPIGKAYVANTFGSIAGSMCVGFLIMPRLGIRGTFVLLILINLATGGLLLLYGQRGPQGERRRSSALGIAAAAGTAILSLAFLPPNLLEAQFEKRFEKLLFYREEITDIVMVTESEAGERWIRYGDGRGTAGTPTVAEDRIYAHIPMMIHPSPKTVLQIGYGVGNTLASVARHPVEEISCAELSPGVVDASPYFAETNRGILADPRVSLIINDGRNVLLTSDERYDVIRLDPPEIHVAGVVNLYTKEFYELARDHLDEGGVFSIWVNAIMTPMDDLKMIVRTVNRVFPSVSVWQSPKLYSFVINGSMRPHHIDLARLLARFEDARIADDLAEIGVDNPFASLRFFAFDGEGVRVFTGEGPIVEDDHTRIDFSTPRSADSYFGFGNVNSGRWLVGQVVRDKSDQRVFLERLNELGRYRRSIVPSLMNVEATSYRREALEPLIKSGGQSG